MHDHIIAQANQFGGSGYGVVMTAPPQWLVGVSWAALVVALVCAIRPRPRDRVFGMQIGMVLGFLTAFPANAWLIRRGIKEAM